MIKIIINLIYKSNNQLGAITEVLTLLAEICTFIR